MTGLEATKAFAQQLQREGVVLGRDHLFLDGHPYCFAGHVAVRLLGYCPETAEGVGAFQVLLRAFDIDREDAWFLIEKNDAPVPDAERVDYLLERIGIALENVVEEE